MKIQIEDIIYIKDGNQTEATTPDSDLITIMKVKTRRKQRSVAYNANTRKAYEIKGYLPWRRSRDPNIKIGDPLHFDPGSLEVFDAALAAFINGENRVILKPHVITVSLAE